MSNAYPLVNNSERQAFVKEQLELRLRVLESWLENAPPDGPQIPTSLNQMRQWDNPDLGIVPIGSSATVTTTHRTHGGLVSRIAKVLAALAAQRSSRPARKKRAAAERKRQLAAQTRMLTAAANQFVVTSARLHEVTLELRLARQQIDVLRSENRQLRAKNRQTEAPPGPRLRSGLVTDLESRRSPGLSEPRC